MLAFRGSNPTKIKAMVETGNVEWDMAQLSRGSILNLQKHSDYFERIDYSLVDDGVGAGYRFEYGLEMLVWAQVMANRTDAFGGAVPKGWADFWDTKKFPGDRANDRHKWRQLARDRIRPGGGRRAEHPRPSRATTRSRRLS